ncbi:hypothetical protein [Xenorhabdus bharatensis]|uniref:hypothetical protein n=1 Tax=Xenorhabdus bharatensis TaxID=3136256 RepID=UPI0030F42ACA
MPQSIINPKMPKMLKEFFIFDQSYWMPKGQGRCVGISLYILTNLYECGIENHSLKELFSLAKMYARMIKMARDPINYSPTVMGNFSHLEQSIATLHFKYCPFGKYPISNFIYTLDCSGFALIDFYLYIKDQRGPGSKMYYSNEEERSNYKDSGKSFSVNHAGFVIWRGAEMFIFDPNTGGGLFDYGNIKITREMINSMSNMLYMNCDYDNRVEVVSLYKPIFDGVHKNTNKKILNNALKDIHLFR